MAQIPKYAEKLLERRRNYARKLADASIAVDDYCKSIGIDYNSPLFDDACLCTDVRIYYEFDGATNSTRRAILKQLEINEKRHKEEE